MDDKELIERMRGLADACDERRWRTDAENLRRAAARLTALAEENERMRPVFEAAKRQRAAFDGYKVECDKYYSLARDCAFETYRRACIETDTSVKAALSEVPR